jgi:hypothetical protein
MGEEDREEMEINIFTAQAPSICPSFVFMTGLLRGRLWGAWWRSKYSNTRITATQEKPFH